MASLTHKLETLAAKRAASKRAVVKVAGVDHNFVSVQWGGASPLVCLELAGVTVCKRAAEWRRLGAKL